MDTVEDDVAFGLENRGWPLGEMRARVPAALAEVGLSGFERRRPTRLSGGEQQRLALAGVLAPRPSILVLDEPTANLDPAGTTAFFERLAALREARAATMVVVEHRVDAAWPLADRVLAFGRDGRPIAFGAPADVLARAGERLRAEGVWLPGERTRPRRASDDAGTGAPIVTAERARFQYVPDAIAVDGASLEIRAAERVALVGGNGSGKSTLARLLVGLLRPTAGRVTLLDADPARLPPAELARRAGYVFQDPERQFLAPTVRAEISLGLTDRELVAAEELMERLGLPLGALGDRSPYQLSGGEKRRLSLASALVRKPALLVLDEPTFGQDRHGYEALLAILDERVDAGAAILAATHDERFVAEACDRRLEMAAGRLRPITRRLAA
jgi:energy-coupling factor transporter ATP-binding protein EcfA2